MIYKTVYSSTDRQQNENPMDYYRLYSSIIGCIWSLSMQKCCIYTYVLKMYFDRICMRNLTVVCGAWVCERVSESNWKTEKLRTRSYVHWTKCIISPPPSLLLSRSSPLESLLRPMVYFTRHFVAVITEMMRECFSIKIVSHSIKLNYENPIFVRTHIKHQQPGLVQHSTAYRIFN